MRGYDVVFYSPTKCKILKFANPSNCLCLCSTRGSRRLEQKRLWCENATQLTGTEWRYNKIRQQEFDKFCPDDFDDLIAFEPIMLA